MFHKVKIVLGVMLLCLLMASPFFCSKPAKVTETKIEGSALSVSSDTTTAGSKSKSAYAKKTYFPNGALKSEETGSSEAESFAESQKRLESLIKYSLSQTVTENKDNNMLTLWGAISGNDLKRLQFQPTGYGFLYQRRVADHAFAGGGYEKTQIESSLKVSTSYTW